ncbi:XrtA system polysaccharide deacetylase [Desulfonema magnum]|uniref:Polysaccharide deacetylase family protein n=1 Tax=Desulfonema magnum TaxID=45655 RepID=A0A975GLH4_9BACT|nr:XrtA system polysaccharide deacetylase [Desulfonema magnum]QTA84823.1 Polysaccharide deacetylase family protein [Desulfonema magnum]
MKNSILITIDVEDWFQVENFKPWIPFSSWSSHELRVEKNTYHLLDLLDHRRATFFILGWLAERLPHLVREIHDRGHEVASHGYYHHLCNRQSYTALRKDLTDSKKRLEDMIGEPVIGYRAPSFSINEDILKIIEASGYCYDSSFNSFAMHGRYGHVDLSGNSKKGIAVKISDDFDEIPISNFKIRKRVFPIGGGGYFRVIPFPFFKLGVRRVLQQDHAYVFYMHPWEIDTEQPRVNEASLLYKFRHYVNLKKTPLKLSALFETFKECSFVTCRKYLNK